MKIHFAKNQLKGNLYNFMRKCGYAPLHGSYARILSSSGYPRFHLYIEETNDQYILNLHLDQKRPSYLEKKAHSGEYEGKVVEEEAERIRELFEI